MSDTQAPAETIILTVNGKEIEAKPGELVIDAAERTGSYIPRFCYHPRLEPVGMCRMCIVEIDTGRGPALQPSCMVTVAPGMVVETESEITKKAQDGVLEFLLINHPLDCPVCDKGGECPLQDQTMSYGPGESRFVEEKRHFEKPIPISDLVALDRERCILCDRCTRFASDVAGDTLIHFQDRGNQTQVNTFPDHPFASYFSGNTVQICPVGALTASPYRFKARPWDLDQVESTCTTCSVGCRTLVQSSRNEVLRYQGVDIDPVNWGWLCDKGRFDFQSVNSEDRLGAPLVRANGALAPVGWGEALSKAAAAIKSAEPGRIALLGGARLTNEDAYAWAKLAKGVIGTDHVDAQMADGLPAELILGLPRATIDQTFEAGGTVLVMAPDLKEELPVLFLRLRHAVVNDGVQVIELAPQRSSISSLATATLLHRPGAEGEVVAALLAGSTEREVGGIDPEAIAATAALLAAGPVTVILGRASVADSGAGVVNAAAAIHAAHPEVRFLPALRRGNVLGALDMGLAPGMLPGRVTLDGGRQWFHDGGWSIVPEERGLDTVGILQAAAAGKIDVLVLLGSDPLSSCPDTGLAAKALAGARTVIVIEQFLTGSAQQADVVLAAAGYAEVDGTTTNIEGRVSTVARKVTPPGTARADWMIAAELARLLGVDLGLESVEQIAEEVEALAPSHAGITWNRLHSATERDGIVVPLSDADRSARPELHTYEVPADTTAPAFDAYSLRLVATRRLYDLGTATQQSPSLAGLVVGSTVRLNPYDFDRLGIEAGNDVVVTASTGSITFEAQPDIGVPRGSAAVLVKQGPNVGSLIDVTAAVTEIRVERGMNLFAVDPLLAGDIDFGIVLIVLLKVVVSFALLLVSVMLMIWFERKLHADMSNRIGPNRAGPFGILQTLADGIKFFFKEDLIPDRADRKIFILAPFLSMVPAFLVFAVVPIGGVFTPEKQGAVKIFGHHTWLQLADPPIGVLFILAMSSIAVYGVMLAGWSSGSKYPLLGSVRASAQMVSYEAALGLSVITVVLLSGSLSTHDIVMSQAGEGFGGLLPRWNIIVTGLVPFVIFVIAGTAELNRPPFDLVEAEQELVGGFHTEYSSIRFALFFLAEFMNTVTMSAIIVTLFLGGPAGPTFFGPDWIWGPMWFLAKLGVFLFMFVWFRATLPRFRYDQLMDLGWKLLIPLALGWMLLLASINIARDEGWSVPLVSVGGFFVMVAGYALLTTAVRTAQRRRDESLEGSS